MADSAPEQAAPNVTDKPVSPPSTVDPVRSTVTARRGWLSHWFRVRDHIPQWETAVLGLLSVVCCLGIWWFVTLGSPEERMVGPLVLPSPGETWDRLPELLLGDERPTEDAEGRPLPPRG